MGDDYDAARPGVAPGAQREQWKQVRTHIHQYEQKLLELQFDYQQKVNVVEALKLELRQLTKDSHDCKEGVCKLAKDTHDTYIKLQELDVQQRAVDLDRAMLAQQLVSEQEGLKADNKKFEDTQAFFTQHLQAQQEHILKLQRAHGAVHSPAEAQQAQQQQQQEQQHGADACAGKDAAAVVDCK